ncbi:MAG: hypothetical protein E7241_00110 [Lachnospiraceae bacterium]|nr:hypothetical protein [Lachnospiraceae bacterium]
MKRRYFNYFIRTMAMLPVVACGLMAGCSGTGSSKAGSTVASSDEQKEEELTAKWGPERSTFTMENPADYPIFNAITNNPTIGDERTFVRIGKITKEKTDLSTEDIFIESGSQYLVQVYIHNNASSTYNDSAHNHVGVAVGTRLSVEMPDEISSDKDGQIIAKISAENTKPAEVWSSVRLYSKDKAIKLKYVAGSAKIYNDWETNGNIIPSSFLSKEGTFVGLNKLDGLMPGCEEYHCIVTFVIDAE